MPKVFVSHAFVDRQLIREFVTNVLALGGGLREEGEIFYSSGSGTGVPSGRVLMDYVKAQVNEAELVVAIITPTFLKRPVCVAEMSIAWAAGKLFPILAPGVSRDVLEGHVLQGVMVGYLDSASTLNELHGEIFRISGTLVSPAIWGDHCARFLEVVKEYSVSPSALPAPAMASVGCGNHLELFRVVSGRLEHRWWPKERGKHSWSEWVEMDPAPNNLAAVAAVSRCPNNIEVAVLDADGQVHHRWWWREGEPAWSPHWDPLGDKRLVPPLTAASLEAGHFEFFAFDEAGDLWSTHHWDEGADRPGWHNWSRHSR